jgi:nucleotide-binding universal stress UspA family protein
MSASQNSAPRIIAGVDGSPPSIAALRWAIHQAELTGGTIDAVIVWEFPVVAGGFGWAPNKAFDPTEYTELAAKTLNAAVAEASPPPGVIVNLVVKEGNPAQVLLYAAKDADLLVVGNRGHGPFVDALIGSVSVRCLHHAACPVVVVRTPPNGS